MSPLATRAHRALRGSVVGRIIESHNLGTQYTIRSQKAPIPKNLEPVCSSCAKDGNTVAAVEPNGAKKHTRITMLMLDAGCGRDAHIE